MSTPHWMSGCTPPSLPSRRRGAAAEGSEEAAPARPTRPATARERLESHRPRPAAPAAAADAPARVAATPAKAGGQRPAPLFCCCGVAWRALPWRGRSAGPGPMASPPTPLPPSPCPVGKRALPPPPRQTPEVAPKPPGRRIPESTRRPMPWENATVPIRKTNQTLGREPEAGVRVSSADSWQGDTTGGKKYGAPKIAQPETTLL